jgi:hypothetical protein
MDWMQYLHARMEYIKTELKEGKTPEEIYHSLSVTPTQVVLLCMTAKKENEKCLPANTAK